MATVGSVNTTLMAIYTGTSPGTKVTCLVNSTLSVTRNMRDITCKDSGNYKDFLPSDIEWTMTGEGNFAYDAANGESQLFGLLTAGTQTNVIFGTGVTGDKKYSGNAYLSALSFNSPGNNETVKFSFTWRGIGAITEATI